MGILALVKGLDMMLARVHAIV